MCGIWCRISSSFAGVNKSDCCSCGSWSECENGTANQKQKEFISRRGPDLEMTSCFDLQVREDDSIKDNDKFSRIHLFSHVLWTQGERPHLQPYTNDRGTKLMLFNGDIYSFTGFREESRENDLSRNDGITLFNLLDECQDAQEMCDIIAKLQGPFAFILFDKSKELIWFARDFFGRESLMFSYESNGADSPLFWDISSVSVHKNENVCEVPTLGLFQICLKSRHLRAFPFSHCRTNVSQLFENFLSLMKRSVFIRSGEICETEAKIESHFSTVLKPIGNVNDRTLKSLLDISKSCCSAEDFIKQCQTTLADPVQEFLCFMRESIRRRVSTLPSYCKTCMEVFLKDDRCQIKCDHCVVGVLFSGGIDSTVIAYLAGEALPAQSTLDLINVAFSKDDNFSNIPDRETAIASYKMLTEKFEPLGKRVNLVLVNVSKPEVAVLRKERIKYLISPLNSVLDDSLGVCLWFAARGRGILHSEDGNGKEYCSPMRIVLLGSGADELLGGYGRHRSAYERSGWEGLHLEMQQEIDRISIRNLGRDNRIVSDHGLCPRMPFLDESLVHFLTTTCELWVKCCPVNEGILGSRGSGEKLLLRAVAAFLFEEEYVALALFPKRAMQFGSRIAKLENSKEKGGDNCQRLL